MQEGAHGDHQFIHGRIVVVASDVVMELFPEFFDIVHPRLIGRLEKYFELWIMVHPGLCQVGFVDDVIIGDEDDFSSTSIGPFEVL